MALVLEHILEDLKKFKRLPTYQFERRIDAFIQPFLVPAFNGKYNTDDFVFVYPEFPLARKKDGLYELNTLTEHADYADYLLWSDKLNLILLIEFKTDSNSVSQEQLDMYVLNCKRGWENIFRSFFKKSFPKNENGKARKNWKLYAFALDFFQQKAMPLTGYLNRLELSKYYDAFDGTGATNHLNEIFEKLNFNKLPSLKTVYLAPEKALVKNNINSISNDAPKYFDGLFTLSEFAGYIDNSTLRKVLEDADKE